MEQQDIRQQLKLRIKFFEEMLIESAQPVERSAKGQDFIQGITLYQRVRVFFVCRRVMKAITKMTEERLTHYREVLRLERIELGDITEEERAIQEQAEKIIDGSHFIYQTGPYAESAED